MYNFQEERRQKTIDRGMYHNNNLPEIGPVFVSLGHASIRGLAIKAG